MLSMYMGLVIELVDGKFRHFSYAALIYHWHTLQLYMWVVRVKMERYANAVVYR